jgi:hypothetical protein
LSVPVDRHSTAEEKDKKGAAGEEGKDDAEPTVLLPLAESIRCLAAAWEAASSTTLSSAGADYAAAIALCLSPFHPWPTRSAALSASQGFVTRLVSGGRVGGGKAAGDVAMGEAEASGEQLEWLAALVPGMLDCTEVPENK